MKDEIKIKWLGSPVILKLERSRGYDSPGADIYEDGDYGLQFYYCKTTRKWTGTYSVEIRDKNNLGGIISVNSEAKTPQLLSNKLDKNLSKLFNLFGLEF